MMQRLYAAILALGILCPLVGCQTPPPSEAAKRGVSTIPWNRPAKGEGGGMLGSQMGAMRGY